VVEEELPHPEEWIWIKHPFSVNPEEDRLIRYGYRSHHNGLN
ncbi:uncharacterized protein METZ01_LOCUS440786, partial [marine metagenome]